jgi:hypothetical protein
LEAISTNFTFGNGAAVSRGGLAAGRDGDAFFRGLLQDLDDLLLALRLDNSVGSAIADERLDKIGKGANVVAVQHPLERIEAYAVGVALQMGLMGLGESRHGGLL